MAKSPNVVPSHNLASCKNSTDVASLAARSSGKSLKTSHVSQTCYHHHHVATTHKQGKAGKYDLNVGGAIGTTIMQCFDRRP